MMSDDRAWDSLHTMASKERFTDLKPYPVELSPPDIAPYRTGNTGIEYFTTFTAPAPGPHVMVTAVMHGNELCGAIVIDELFRSGFRPERGKLTLGFCNVEAFLNFDAEYPTLSRFVDEDMNRLWDAKVIDGPRDSQELRRVRTIRPLIDTADYLLDIHSMQHPTEPLMLAGPLDKGRRLAEAVGVPRRIVMDRGHAAGRRMRDYGPFSDRNTPRAALLVECGQHWARASVDVARQTMVRFLVCTGAAPPEMLDLWLGPNRPPAQQVIEVTSAITVRTDSFAFVEPYVGMEVIPKAGTLLARDGEEAIHTPHDNCVLIMPSRRLGKGQTAVRLGRVVD